MREAVGYIAIRHFPMASATRPRPASRSTPPPPVGNGRGWVLPVAAAAVALVALILGSIEVLPLELALAAAILAGLVGAAGIGTQPVLEGTVGGNARAISLGFAALCCVAAAVPSLARVFPGVPLLDRTALSGPDAKLPVTIPTAGRGRIDLVTEGNLAPTPSGATVPVHFTFTVADEAGTAIEIVTGEFSEELKTRRLGRRGTSTVHQQHTSSHQPISTGGQANLLVTAATVEPQNAPPIFLTVYPRHLPPWPVALAAGLALLAGAIFIDRLPEFSANDGAFTLATGAVLGATYFFTTDNAAHPGVGTLVGATIFGGALGLAVSGLSWWISKRLAPVPR